MGSCLALINAFYPSRIHLHMFMIIDLVLKTGKYLVFILMQIKKHIFDRGLTQKAWNTFYLSISCVQFLRLNRSGLG